MDDRLARLKELANLAVDAFAERLPLDDLVLDVDHPLNEDYQEHVSTHELIVFGLDPSDLHRLVVAYQGYEDFCDLVFPRQLQSVVGKEIDDLLTWLRQENPDRARRTDDGTPILSLEDFTWFAGLVFDVPRRAAFAYSRKREMNTLDLVAFDDDPDPDAA